MDEKMMKAMLAEARISAVANGEDTNKAHEELNDEQSFEKVKEAELVEASNLEPESDDCQEKAVAVLPFEQAEDSEDVVEPRTDETVEQTSEETIVTSNNNQIENASRKTEISTNVYLGLGLVFFVASFICAAYTILTISGVFR